MKKQSVYVTPPSDESNNVLQMKITFKKINPRHKLRVITILTMIINQQIIITTITRNLSIEDKYYLLRLWEEGPENI